VITNKDSVEDEKAASRGAISDTDPNNLSGQGSVNSGTKLSDDENTEDLTKSEFEGGSGDAEIIFQPDLGSETDSDFRVKQEVGYPSLEEAMDIKFDLNDVTNIQQRLRNLNCQPRNVKDLYPAPFHLLTKREKRCKDCHKFVIKPNINPTSNEKMKADF
jgi:hypothetical protein